MKPDQSDPIIDHGDHDDEPAHRQRAWGDPRAVVMRWAVPPDGHGLDGAGALAHKVRRLGRERAASVVAAGDFRVVEGGVSRAIAADERLAKGTLVEVWRMPPDDPADIVEEPGVLLHQGGLIVVDRHGTLGRFATTEKMAWASARATGGCALFSALQDGRGHE